MNASELIQAHHRTRKAVIYIRQSTGHQVLSNVESRRMQHAMFEQAKHLGWDESRIEVVEADTGTSAQSTEGREAYKRLLGDIALGQVGAVLSYESTRLSRNCSDWYPLLDVCTHASCLIADRDGVYDPSSPNGRLLLGMKGMISEVELHTLRGRLVAGVQNKARRGELAVALPVGLERLKDGRVQKNPDLQVQTVLELIFRLFLSLKSVFKVMRQLLVDGINVPRRHRNEETVWRPPTSSALMRILKNPAYAGAFAYGQTKRTTAVGVDGRTTEQHVRKQHEWTIVIKDRYPAYVSWDTFESIQAIIRDNYAEFERRKSRGIPRPGEVLLQGLTFCGNCGHKLVAQYAHGCRYICNFLRRRKNELALCQYISAEPVDRYVLAAFFEAVSGAELDVYDAAVKAARSQRTEIDVAKERELQRLRYEVHLAQRQYSKVDPDHRLVASELERRWEVALCAQRDAEERFARDRRDAEVVALSPLSAELRETFSHLGAAFPELWRDERLTRVQRKAFLRCVIEKVVLRRLVPDRVHVRVVWRGGQVSELDVPLPVRALRELSNYAELEVEVLALADAGKSDEEIASTLTSKGFRSPSCEHLLPGTVHSIRTRRNGSEPAGAIRGAPPDGFLTIRQLADRLGVDPQWLYVRIDRGTITINRNLVNHRYFVPDRPDILTALERLRNGLVEKLNICWEHQDA